MLIILSISLVCLCFNQSKCEFIIIVFLNNSKYFNFVFLFCLYILEMSVVLLKIIIQNDTWDETSWCLKDVFKKKYTNA